MSMTAWDKASNTERADRVRSHASIGSGRCPCCGQARPGKALTYSALMDLFDLNAEELKDVLDGADYPLRS